MKLTQAELYQRLKTTGYPVAYHAFIVDAEHPAPEPPFIVYLRTFDTTIASDFEVHGKWKNYQVELYTKEKDIAAERKVEAVLNHIDPEYDTSEIYIENEGLYQIVYLIKVVEI